MFDLLLRQGLAGAGVPVPVAGRGIVFLGADGLFRVRLPDGSVSVMGVKRAKVEGVAAGESVQVGAGVAATFGAGGVWDVQVFGRVTSPAGADLVVSVMRGAVALLSVPLDMTAGAIDVPWCVKLRVLARENEALVTLDVSGDGGVPVMVWGVVDLMDGGGVSFDVAAHCVGGAVSVTGGVSEQSLFLT